MEFGTGKEFDDFQNRLHSLVEQNPSGFRETWEVIVDTNADGKNIRAETSSRSHSPYDSGDGNAREMLEQQLRAMQGRYQENSQREQLLEGMIKQIEKGPGNESD